MSKHTNYEYIEAVKYAYGQCEQLPDTQELYITTKAFTLKGFLGKLFILGVVTVMIAFLLSMSFFDNANLNVSFFEALVTTLLTVLSYGLLPIILIGAIWEQLTGKVLHFFTESELDYLVNSMIRLKA